MRTPDQEGSGEDTVSSSVGDGFGASAGDLEDGFGDDDFSDDDFSDDDFSDDDFSDDDFSDGDDTGDISDTPFGDGLSDAEAENVLVEILEDVFGSDTEALDEAGTGGSGAGSGDGGLFEAFDGAGAGVDEAFDPFEPTEVPSDTDLDLAGDGRVDVHDLHEAAHPFDFGMTE